MVLALQPWWGDRGYELLECCSSPSLSRSVCCLPLWFTDPEAALLLLPTWTAAQLNFLFFFTKGKKGFQAISRTSPGSPCKWLWLLETHFPSCWAQVLPQAGEGDEGDEAALPILLYPIWCWEQVMGTCVLTTG